MSTAAAPTTRVESVLQRAELELWRDNIDGALDLLARAHTLAPDHRYAARAEEIRSWLRHLESRGAYAAAYEEYYRRSKGRLDLKRLERDVRILLGRKTRKTVRRVVDYPEYQLLEREIIERRPARVLDAGCGEGRIALCLGHRFPSHPGDGRRSLGDQRRHRAASQSLPQRGVSARPRRGRGRRHGARVLRPRLLLRGARARARRRDDGGRAPAYAATGRPVLFRRPDERVGGHRPGPGVPASGRRGRPRPRLHRGWPARAVRAPPGVLAHEAPRTLAARAVPGHDRAARVRSVLRRGVGAVKEILSGTAIWRLLVGAMAVALLLVLHTVFR